MINTYDIIAVFLGVSLSVNVPNIGLPKPLAAANGITRPVIRAPAATVSMPELAAISRPTGLDTPIAISPASVPMV